MNTNSTSSFFKLSSLHHIIAPFVSILLILVSVQQASGDPEPIRSITVDENAWMFNWASFDQDKIVSFGNYQYTIYWDANKELVVVRRDLRSDEVQTVHLGHTLTQNPRDGHRNTVVGISPSDGRLHLSWDHHVNRLRYTKTRKGFLSHPPQKMSADDFEAPQQLTEDAPQNVTYPRFFNDHSGTLYFAYRSGSSGNGRTVFAVYDGDKGTWNVTGTLFGAKGTFEPWNNSSSRNAYLHDVLFDRNNRLHVTWVYREEARTYASNHDLHYAYSDDRGVTWKNNNGVKIANLEQNDPILLDDPGIVVRDIPVHSWLMNQCSMAIDSRNQPHVATYHVPLSDLKKRKNVDHGPRPDARRKQRLFHYYRTPDGTWKSSGPLALPNGLRLRRPNIVIDQKDNIVIYWASGKGFRAYVAHADEGWNNWRLVKMTGPKFTSNDNSKHDRRLLNQNGILSLTADPKGKREGRGFAILDFSMKELVEAENSAGEQK